MNKIVLTNIEPGMSPDSDELAAVILARIGLLPRKEGSTDKMHKVLLELYERQKLSNRDKQPEKAIMTVEEMGFFAGITRQTMYDYLKRWLSLNLISKTSYIRGPKVIIGYKLNGNTLESAFEKAYQTVQNNLSSTQALIKELQKRIKNEKISTAQKERIVDDNKEIFIVQDERTSEEPSTNTNDTEKVLN